MPTIGEAINALETELFVGRARELEALRRWLDERLSSAQPEILNLNGPGGIGKSALVRAFLRIAASAGRATLYVDAETVAPHVEAFCAAAGAESPRQLVERLNEDRPLVVIDSFGYISALTHSLQTEVLEKLDASVPVVITTRTPLRAVWGARSVWGRLIRPLTLEALDDEARTDYLRRRGVEDADLIQEIAISVGGFPLGLSLAADMVGHLGITQLPRSPEWHLVIQSLVNQLLNDVDEEVRSLLDVCAIVRQFDEMLLDEVSDAPNAAAAFDRLCNMSIVRPADHGLMLHEDVSRMLADNLRWRDRTRFDQLRTRSLAHYRRRAATAGPDERAWLVAERFYLWQDSLIQKLFFMQDSPGRIWVDTGREDDLEAIIAIWFRWLDAIPTPEAADAQELETERIWLDRFLRVPDLRLRVFRDAEGEVTGFSTIVPVHQETVDLLQSHPYRGAVVGAFLRAHPEVRLPEPGGHPRISYLFQLSMGDREPQATYAEILRDSVGYFAEGGILLAATIPETHRALTAAMGFKIVPGSKSYFRGLEIDGQILDLDSIGVENWLEAVVTGRKPPESLSRAEFERALQDVLLNWRDDAALAGSPLATLTESGVDATDQLVAGALREVISAAIETGSASSTDDQQLAFRALQLAYIDKIGSHEAVAERLAVSRSTFYRLLKRGISAVADRFRT